MEFLLEGVRIARWLLASSGQFAESYWLLRRSSPPRYADRCN
jgi:hypothetical protein